jgi:hypothetical protein
VLSVDDQVKFAAYTHGKLPEGGGALVSLLNESTRPCPDHGHWSTLPPVTVAILARVYRLRRCPVCGLLFNDWVAQMREALRLVNATARKNLIIACTRT